MSTKDLSGRLARWSLHLQSYDFTIVHRPGNQNIVPDILSRISADIHGLIDLDSDALKSDNYLELMATIEKNKNQLPDLRVMDGFAYKRTVPYNGESIGEDFAWKLWVPMELTSELIAKAHNPPQASHGGSVKTLKRLREYFFWPHQSSQVKTFIEDCQTCKEAKPANVILRPPMGQERLVERPFQRIFIDFLRPYPRSRTGNTYIFIVLDHLTKFVLLNAMPKASSQQVVKFLISEVFHKFGTPETIVSDNGKQFVSKEFTDMAKNFGIQHNRTALYSPQANASERVNQSVLSAIRSYLGENQMDWDSHLSEIEYSLRSSVHTTIGITPYFALFGSNMIGHGSVYKLARQLQLLEETETEVLPKGVKTELVRKQLKETLHQAYLKNEKSYNTRSRIIRFIPGQEVYRRNFRQSEFKNNYNAKLASKFLRCRIVKPVGNSLYQIEDMHGKALGIFHGKDLKQ